MRTRVSTVGATAGERDQIAAAVRVARHPRARLVSGDESVGLPPALVRLVEIAGETFEEGNELALVDSDAEVSPADAAELLGVTRQYVDRLVASGALPVRRLPGSRYRRIPVSAVLALRAGETRAQTPTASDGDDGQTIRPAPRSMAATARGRERRERLIAATALLVAEKGFYSVGITEIGAAAGVTGAAIYRHFPNKTQMLVAVFDQVVEELLEGSAQIIASAVPPAEMLETLVRHHVRLVLRNPAIFGVYIQEAHNLPSDDRSRLRSNQRAYVLRWSAVLQTLRPGLADDEARTRAQATFGLLHSLADYPSPLPPDRLAPLLTAMALASLTAP